MSEAELREEVFKLFGKLNQVQEYYLPELASENDRKAVLEGYKAKIYNEFWTRGGNPRPIVSNSKVKQIIADFEKISAFPHELIDLILYRVRVATEYANTFGGMSDTDYNTSFTAFAKAMKLVREQKLEDMFREQCFELLKYDNVDGWYIEWLDEEIAETFVVD